MKLINPFSSTNLETRFYEFHISPKVIFQYGDYCIIKQFDKSFLYCFEDIVFAERAGVNEDLIRAVANRNSINVKYFDYERAIIFLEKGKKIKAKLNESDN